MKTTKEILKEHFERVERCRKAIEASNLIIAKYKTNGTTETPNSQRN